ncbi:hypothetical protein B0J12DRAFT_326796 [Macrophomina phaseolina]|uniref:Uncharacterized protein n=1 Tax=Macrophomina phaseolina TaxID=35725 RepID=A0ABQ8FV67_9PEZI|nr:hypothetical protein B0J12DRAFT_326796 [Macrophomina phaseolina]
MARANLGGCADYLRASQPSHLVSADAKAASPTPAPRLGSALRLQHRPRAPPSPASALPPTRLCGRRLRGPASLHQSVPASTRQLKLTVAPRPGPSEGHGLVHGITTVRTSARSRRVSAAQEPSPRSCVGRSLLSAAGSRARGRAADSHDGRLACYQHVVAQALGAWARAARGSQLSHRFSTAAAADASDGRLPAPLARGQRASTHRRVVCCQYSRSFFPPHRQPFHHDGRHACDWQPARSRPAEPGHKPSASPGMRGGIPTCARSMTANPPKLFFFPADEASGCTRAHARPPCAQRPILQCQMQRQHREGREQRHQQHRQHQQLQQ